jgi:hypothetical protein
MADSAWARLDSGGIMCLSRNPVREGKPLMAKWFAVQRRYIVTETAYVQARTATEARAKVADGDFFDSDGPEIQRYFAPGSTRRVDGVPLSMWEAAGYPDDIPVAS